MKRRLHFASFRRIVALAVLLWGAADLAIPGWCQVGDEVATRRAIAEVSRTPGTLARSDAPAVCRIEKPAFTTQRLTSMLAADSQQQQLQPEDDCWCCCSHVSPTTNFASTHVERVMSDEYLAEAHAVAGILSLQYHPPRA